jgi:hypothetical protein
MNLEDLYRLLRSDHVQAQGIVDSLEEPLLVLEQSGSQRETARFLRSSKSSETKHLASLRLEPGNGTSQSCDVC